MMQPQHYHDEHAYLAMGYLELRCQALRKLLEAFSLHCMNYPALYNRAEAAKWVEEGNRLIADAEKVLKEEGRR